MSETKWQIEVSGKIYEADIQTIKDWIQDKFVVSTDKIKNDQNQWVSVLSMPELRHFFIKDSDIDRAKLSNQGEKKSGIEKWQVDINKNVFDINDAEIIKTWIIEGRIHPSDKLKKGNFSWVEAGVTPTFRDLFKIENSILLQNYSKICMMCGFRYLPHDANCLICSFDLTSPQKRKIIISTGDFPSPYKIVDVVFAYGNSSETFFKVVNLQEAYERVSTRLEENAGKIGADAVLWVKYDFRVAISPGYSGQNDLMRFFFGPGQVFEVFATGTAVKKMS